MVLPDGMSPHRTAVPVRKQLNSNRKILSNQLLDEV